MILHIVYGFGAARRKHEKEKSMQDAEIITFS